MLLLRRHLTCHRGTYGQSPKYSCYSTIKEELRKFNSELPLEEAYTPPKSWYFDQNFFKLETDRVFKKNWVGICSDNSLKNPGDYISNHFLNNPYVIIVNDSQETNSFHNVCSHHASQIVSGTGKCDQLVCPYHGWTYNLNGSLVKTTSMRGLKNFKMKQNGLKKIDMEKLGPIIFFNFSSNLNGNFEDLIKPVKDSLAIQNFNPSFEDLVFIERKEYSMKCNWKIFVENYCDGGYHVPYAHKELNQKLDLTSYKSEVYPKCSIQSTLASKETKTEYMGEGAVYAYIYPNMMINRYGPFMDINIVYPVNHEECVVIIEWFIKKELAEQKEFILNSLKQSDRVQQEDVGLCEGVMRGMLSDAYEVGRYIPSKELPMYHFHQTLLKDMLDE